MTARHKGMALAVLALSQLMVVLDASIVNVALPSIQSALEFAPTDLPWIVNAYTLVFGGFLLLGGRFADRFGRRRVFVIGLGAFVAASAIGGAAQTSAMLIAARALQGFGGALMAPAALSLITVIFEEGPERNKALGVWGALAAGGAAVGVLLGGVLVEYLDWRWVFFVNIPFALLAIFGALEFVPESNDEHITGFDVAGAVTVTAGLVALVYALVRGNEVGWFSAQSLVVITAAAILLTAFVLIQRRAAHPLVPGRIFERRNVLGADLASLLLGCGLFGMFFYVSLYMQQVLQYSPVKTGLGFLPVSLVIMMSAGGSSQLLGKLGARRLASAGLFIAACGMTLLTRVHPGGDYLSTVLLPLFVIGVGMGAAFVSLTAAAVAGVPHRDSGLASALFNTSQQIGGALGLAVVTAIATARIDSVKVLATAVPTEITSGWAWGFLTGAGFLFIGSILAATLIDISKEESAEAAHTAMAGG